MRQAHSDTEREKPKNEQNTPAKKEKQAMGLVGTLRGIVGHLVTTPKKTIISVLLYVVDCGVEFFKGEV